IIERRLVYLRQRSLRRVLPRVQPDDGAREAQHRSPDRTVRSRGDGVEGAAETLVLGGIERLVGLHIGIPLAIAVGVDDERGPPLRLYFIMRLVEHLRVQPADDLAAA